MKQNLWWFGWRQLNWWGGAVHNGLSCSLSLLVRSCSHFHWALFITYSARFSAFMSRIQNGDGKRVSWRFEIGRFLFFEKYFILFLLKYILRSDNSLRYQICIFLFFEIWDSDFLFLEIVIVKFEMKKLFRITVKKSIIFTLGDDEISLLFLEMMRLDTPLPTPHNASSIWCLFK